MPRRTSIKPLQEMSEINMTPLIDLTFLLLITFMITMPLLEQGIPVNLPKGKARDLDQKDSYSITLDDRGGLFLDRQAVTKDELSRRILDVARDKPDATVMVRADETIPYGRLVEIMRILNDAKISRMALVTTPDAPPAR